MKLGDACFLSAFFFFFFSAVLFSCFLPPIFGVSAFLKVHLAMTLHGNP